jgi:uncharacterized phage-associated protein
MRSIEPRFREDKTTQAAAILLELSGGRMNYMKLIKLLYLVDRTALSSWGQPVSFDLYVSMNQGPVLSRTLDLINEGRRPGHTSYWNEHISSPQGYSVRLIHPTDADKLSDAEVDLIHEVYEQFGHMDKWDLVDLLHRELGEWKHPHGSCTAIGYEDILKAVGKDETELSAILGELALVTYLDERLSSEAV